MPKWRLSTVHYPDGMVHIVRRHLKKAKHQLYWDDKWHDVPLDQQGNPDFDQAYKKAKKREVKNTIKRFRRQLHR